jgi:hypothetical protein
MTEEQIEQLHELRVDALDRALMNGMPQAEYEAALKAVDRWAERAKARATPNT